MIILDMAVDWNHGYGNSPDLVLQVDRIYSPEEFRYENKAGLWYGIRDDQVSFFAWKGPENEGGYYGREYVITTTNGKKVTLKGPWSSRSSVLNYHFTQQCIEVKLTTNPLYHERGRVRCEGGFYFGAITIERANMCLCRLGAHLKKNCLPYETIYQIVDNETGGKRVRYATRGIKPCIGDHTGIPGWEIVYNDEDGNLLAKPTHLFRGASPEELKMMLKRYENQHDIVVKDEWWEVS